MARLTPDDYLGIRRWLVELWAEWPQEFGLISYQNQRYLHDYFLLDVTLTDHELLCYRKKISGD